jgi:hypothetical protein
MPSIRNFQTAETIHTTLTADVTYLRAWATSQKEGKGRWIGKGGARLLASGHFPSHPVPGWTTMCISTSQRSLQISCDCFTTNSMPWPVTHPPHLKIGTFHGLLQIYVSVHINQHRQFHIFCFYGTIHLYSRNNFSVCFQLLSLFDKIYPSCCSALFLVTN